ncbi:YfbM family protein [Chitinophaga sp. GCM10012297]|uniref:YfbM family protein n=1 Tax=Chitinophaga chungangae TaxID=2821488 RepID=A0ABS3YLN4_9BACT|nr:YfbM family protein [Chitinophaga chungangae]MBO9154989.1 YfbM family protein [Chitinophaga chungangae]
MTYFCFISDKTIPVMGMIANLLRVTNAEPETYISNSALLEERIYENEEEDLMLTDIDKSWEGILFLLTGQNLEKLDHPLGRVLFSGRVIDENQDLGYGPGHYLTPKEVGEMSGALAGITKEELTQRLDSPRMTELAIYPEIWAEENALGYLLDYFEVIQTVYATAAKNNEAVITFLN